LDIKKIKWGIYLTVATGFLTLSLLPDFSSIAIGLFLLVLIPSWFMVRQKEPFAGYTRSWRLASVLFVLFTLILLFLRIKPAHTIFAYQLGFLQVSKAFNPKTHRDILWMWFLAFLMIVITAILTMNSLFPFFLLVFLFLSIYTFLRLNVLYEIEKLPVYRNHSPQKASESYKRIIFVSDTSFTSLFEKKDGKHSWRRITLYSFVSSLIVSIIIFLFIPRISPSSYGIDATSYKHFEDEMVFTGFSTEINLGSLRHLQTNEQPVMKVKLDDKKITEASLYLRGGTFDIFTGTTWIKSDYSRKYRLYSINPRTRHIGLDSYLNKAVKFEEDKPVQNVFSSSLIKQEIEYTDFSSRHIFALPRLAFFTSNSGAVDTIYKDQGETCFIVPPKMVKNYEVFSAPEQYREKTDTDIRDASNESFTQIPSSLNKKRLEELCSRIVGNASTTFEKARRIESFLLNEYQYTNRLGALRGKNPVEEFLFSVKAGHCELFATSMIMLLRTQNIPCRLSFGFHGGIYDDKERCFIVRQKDAHTWVEVLDSRQGWTRFDPTAPLPLTIYGGRIYFKKLFDTFRRLSQRWEDITVGYDHHFQARVVRNFMNFMKKKTEAVFSPVYWEIKKSRALHRLVKNLDHPFIIFLSIVLFVINVIAIRLYIGLKRKGNTRSPKYKALKNGHLSYRWYRRLIKTIAGAYIERPSFQTPREFILCLGDNNNIPAPILEEGCKAYYALRYDSYENIPNNLERLRLLLEELGKIRENQQAGD